MALKKVLKKAAKVAAGKVTGTSGIGSKASKALAEKKMQKTATPRKTTTAPNKTKNTKNYMY